MNPLATTTSDVAPPISEFYDRALLKRSDPFLVHGLFAQEKRLKKGHGDRVKFRRYRALDSTPIPLEEGVPPTGKRLAADDITQDVEWFGDFVTLTDKLLLTTVDPVLMESTRVLGEQGGQILDKVVRNELQAGTNVSYAGDDFGNAAAGRTTTVGRINKVLLDKVVRTMDVNQARVIAKRIKGSSNYGSEPVAPAFWAIVGAKVKFDLLRIPGFTKVKDYAGMKQVHPSEIGAYENIRFILTDQPKTWINAATGATLPSGVGSTGGTYADVYGVLIFGADSHGAIKLDGMSMKHIAKQLGSGGTSDPLNQIATSGWKAAQSAVILNDNWLLRLEVAASA
jgi:N4-gp56 family major capsid protein